MLLEAKPFRIEPQQQQRLRDIAQRVLDVVEDWKSKQTQRMSVQGMSRDELLHQVKKYIRSQRGGKLLIGTIRGMDHSQKRERTYNVLLSVDENVGGYFDDEYSAADMLQIKHVAQRSGELYACKKFRVGIETVRRALRIPEDIIRGVPARYMGRGEIVLTFDSIRKSIKLPQISEVLTHEFTHAVQHYKEQSPGYSDVLDKIHKGKEKLTPEEWVTYMTEPLEFEAQLRGLVEYVEMRYKESSDPKAITSNYTEAEIFKMTGLLDEDGVQAMVERSKKKYIEDAINNLLHANIETCQYMHMHMDELTERMNDLIRLCQTGKFKHADACSDYRKLKRQYPLAASAYGQFICATAMSPDHWKRLKLTMAHCISNLPK